MSNTFSRHENYNEILTMNFRKLNLDTSYDYYPMFDKVTARSKRIFAAPHGTEYRPNLHGVLPWEEGKVEPGTIVYVDANGEVRPLRIANATDDSTYNGGTGLSTIVVGTGEAARFRVGLDLYEVAYEADRVATVDIGGTDYILPLADASTPHLIGTITAIDKEDDEITVDGESTLAVGQDCFVYCSEATGHVIPTIAGICVEFVAGATSVDDDGNVTYSDAPVLYLRHFVVIKEMITHYSEDAYVLNKLRAELPVLDWLELAKYN